MQLKELLALARKASSHASQAILSIYKSEDFGVDMKSDDSPLTKADKKGHDIICSYLEKSGIPILSEEGDHSNYKERKHWSRLWIVDPLDGTKEFIKRNGEFTVNIALVEEQRPILGVVEAPVLDFQYYGIVGEGAFKVAASIEQNLSPLDKLDISRQGLKVVASRSHLNDETKEFLTGLNNPDIVSMGSSLKFMMIAEGKADIYPRFAPTMEWDTAAAHAIMLALGGNVFDNKQKPLMYNKENLLNPHFEAY